ncbi:MAG: sugar ABC transporter ATP-binding protein [Methylobacteriaceae bacterium]|nr:sugar ABC transporter ATP-binding protein [Methylobacteriaceae bacterium]MBV9703872.1 sugar ABC transporter ATP-binding protein [Methylobacteriaceae bacterium]
MTAPARHPVLELRSVSKSYGPVRALRGVSLKVEAGEVVGLIGDNGAGKSTLISLVSGSAPPDRGEILVEGAEKTFESALDARDAGIETVFQALALAPTLNIVENVYLGRELLRRDPIGRSLKWLDKGAMRREVASGFQRLGLTLPAVTTKVAALSGGQRQAVAIARAVLWDSRIVLLDEPTAALGVKQTEIVLGFIQRLKQHGVAVIFVSHNMQQVLRVVDRVIVLRLGRKVFDGARANLTGPQLVGLMTGALAEEASVARTAPAVPGPSSKESGNAV